MMKIETKLTARFTLGFFCPICEEMIVPKMVEPIAENVFCFMDNPCKRCYMPKSMSRKKFKKMKKVKK